MLLQRSFVVFRILGERTVHLKTRPHDTCRPECCRVDFQIVRSDRIAVEGKPVIEVLQINPLPPCGQRLCQIVLSVVEMPMPRHFNTQIRLHQHGVVHQRSRQRCFHQHHLLHGLRVLAGKSIGHHHADVMAY